MANDYFTCKDEKAADGRTRAQLTDKLGAGTGAARLAINEWAMWFGRGKDTLVTNE